jgi:bifunctional N-acetylglucosamine-1-phosphate-uridyltransferase/glucosamine-1-phosphate-acetyltransferase GlmU-like protein
LLIETDLSGANSRNIQNNNNNNNNNNTDLISIANTSDNAMKQVEFKEFVEVISILSRGTLIEQFKCTFQSNNKLLVHCVDLDLFFFLSLL